MQYIDPTVLKIKEEYENNSDDSITITHHLESSDKCKVEIIILDSNNELPNAFPESTNKEFKSEQTNKQRSENTNEKNLYIHCKYLLKLNLYMIYWYLYWINFFFSVREIIFTYYALKGYYFYKCYIVIRVNYALLLSYAFYGSLTLFKSDLYVIF